MEATAVSLARSVLDGVVSSAGSAIADEVAQLLGVPREVNFIRSELEMMKSFLKTASAQPEAVRNDTVRTWVKQVRDLAYDVEDCLLDFERYAAKSRGSWNWSWLPGPLTTRHRIAARIRDLKASVEELNQRNLRYHVVVDQYRVPSRGYLYSTADDHPSAVLLDQELDSAKLALRVSNIIGRNHDKHELTTFLSRSHATGDALTVVSVWGMGGMGKSSLVKMVHNDPVLLDEFDCSAWVTVPHPLDSTEEFKRRLRRHLNMRPDQLDIHAYLGKKRYAIIVDDLLSQEEWELIWPVLDYHNGMGSRIIVTTRREDVATHCKQSVGDEFGHVYQLKPLGEDESKDLLYQKVYRTTQYTLPEELEEQAAYILKRCRGLPLAISTIGGLLANRPKTRSEWMKLHEHLGAELESNDLRDITRVIESSYDGLPYELKSIFLYLSIFPEDQEIKYSRLLRRWMAEGYITKNRDMPVEVVGEHLYNQLINRSMIQPSEKKISTGKRADRCRVHDMVLQIILSKSIEENQLFHVNKHCHEAPRGKTRHLVVSNWKERNDKLENVNLSYIRSLTVFEGCPISLISPKMRLLRVLDLEDTTEVKNKDLKHIGELHHLRYLCLRGTTISKLPSSLQNLQYLETLDIQDTKVTRLPSGMAKLQKLRYLIAGVNFSKDLLQKVTLRQVNMDNYCKASCLCCNNSDKVTVMDQFSVRAPEGIEKLRNLQMLSVINVGQDKGVARKIKDMTNLQRLGVAGLTEEEGQELCRSIKSLNRLHRLELRSDSLTFLATMDTTAAPKHLVSLRLYGNLLRFPEWIVSLNELAKVKLMGTHLNQGEVGRLGSLRNLVLLGLWENSYTGTSLHFDTGMFPKLKFLDIDGLEKIQTIEIKNNALPEVERLWLNNCGELQDNDGGLRGVPCLSNLNELVLKNCGDKEELMKILQKQISGHHKRPKFLIGKIIPTASNPTTSITSSASEE